MFGSHLQKPPKRKNIASNDGNDMKLLRQENINPLQKSERFRRKNYKLYNSISGNSILLSCNPIDKGSYDCFNTDV